MVAHGPDVANVETTAVLVLQLAASPAKHRIGILVGLKADALLFPYINLPGQKGTGH